MKRRYTRYADLIDIDRYEEAIGFNPIRTGANKHGEAEDIGHCPDPWNLHKNGDTTGKFAINRDRRIWGCFVCGGGDLKSLSIAIKGISDEEADEWLYSFVQPPKDTDFLGQIEAILNVEARLDEPLPYFNAHVLERWSNIAPIEGWLRERGISEEIAQRAHVGYQANATRMAPLVPNKPRGEPYKGPCVYFPHFWKGRLVGWQQRWLAADRPKKYTNSGSFPRAETVYTGGMRDGIPIVCESIPTALFSRSLGYSAVATFGASVSQEQIKYLRRFQQGIVLAPDNDAPGRKWTRNEGGIPLAEELARFVPVRVMETVGEYDMGDDIGDLVDEGLPFAREALKVLYEEATYY